LPLAADFPRLPLLLLMLMLMLWEEEARPKRVRRPTPAPAAAADEDANQQTANEAGMGGDDPASVQERLATAKSR
jgi:hypothetical protein